MKGAQCKVDFAEACHVGDTIDEATEKEGWCVEEEGGRRKVIVACSVVGEGALGEV